MDLSEELRVKRQRITQLLDTFGLDGLYLKRQSNFSWATGGGINTVGITGELGAAGLLFTRSGDYAVCNNIEVNRMGSEERLEELGFVLKSYTWHENREQQIVHELVEPGRLGADFAFPGARELKAEVARLRYSLTESELERYRQLCYLTNLALETTAVEVRPGDRECEVIGRLSERLWADRIDIVTTFCAADERIEQYRHPVATRKQVEKRVMLGCNARRNGLIVCLTRFVQFGTAPEKLKKQYRDNVELDLVLWTNTVPGRSVQVPFNAVEKEYRRLGYDGEFNLHHQGGAIGYAPRDYRVDFSTEETIAENQPFCWNPSITGTKSEDTILATQAGPVPLTRPIIFPKLSMDVNGARFERADILVI
ncbi:M24 family metallopeptidase [Marispirochaeta aestuarii]|uniref:M24 family metallopeptidase n=1 Tax=Marispirochaeta aestuarii TaxID=1963862 RepID=UPI0029C911C9|nr:M24 family metallopeptidase [Marispirochaeta aestuarii]